MGPATDPMVVAQTTTDRSRPRLAGAARSAAAYLVWLLAVVPPPKRNIPTTISGNEPATAAAMTTAAPMNATTRPSRSPQRRPRNAERLRTLGAHAIAVDEVTHRGKRTFGIIAYFEREPERLPETLEVKCGKKSVRVPLVAKVSERFRPDKV